MNTGTYQYDLDNPLVYRNEMGMYKTERQLSFIQRFLGRDSMKILDIGGGGGRLAIPIANLGHRLTVIDISQEALTLLRKRTHNTVEAIHADILSFEYTEPFDVAIAVDTLKYVSSRSLTDTFKTINSFLKINGLLIMADINKNSWRNHLSSLLGRRRHHKYNIESPHGYKDALTTAGFEIVSISGFLWMPFGFNSNSPFVHTFKRVEDALHLGSWIRQSPWLLIAARKANDINSRTRRLED